MSKRWNLMMAKAHGRTRERRRAVNRLHDQARDNVAVAERLERYAGNEPALQHYRLWAASKREYAADLGTTARNIE